MTGQFTPGGTDGGKAPVAEDTLRAIGTESRDCLEWILPGMGISAGTEILVREGQVAVNIICGQDSSIVIGRKGQTLEALQLLVNRIVSRKHPEVLSGAKIILDVEGYRERRRHNIVDMARRAAEEVRETGEPSLLNAMNSYERFLVHNALKEEKGIITSSRGEGALKEILISPIGDGTE